MSKYNRLPRPIAVLGYRSAFMHLCEHCGGLDPHNNPSFFHVDSPEAAISRHFICLMEIDGAKETVDYNLVRSLALGQIVNDTTARQSGVRRGD